MQNAPAVSSLWLYAALIAMLMAPFEWNGWYYFLAITLLAPLLVLYGGKAKTDHRLLIRVSEFLGWLSYPLYCVHDPVFNILWFIDRKDGFAQQIGVPVQVVAIALSLLVACSAAYIFDRIKVQRRLTTRLQQAFAALL